MTTKTKSKPVQPSLAIIDSAFQQTANAIGGDIFQICIECGEEPVLHRESVMDYVEIYGGEHRMEVTKWMRGVDYDERHKILNLAGVPNTWT